MDVPSWAFKGAKVVCVEQSPPGAGVCPIVLNETYTIRAVVTRLGGCGVYLEGMVNSCPVWGETAYRIRRFRPLVSQQDDIKTHFQALLDQPMREVV